MAGGAEALLTNIALRSRDRQPRPMYSAEADIGPPPKNSWCENTNHWLAITRLGCGFSGNTSPSPNALRR